MCRNVTEIDRKPQFGIQNSLAKKQNIRLRQKMNSCFKTPIFQTSGFGLDLRVERGVDFRIASPSNHLIMKIQFFVFFFLIGKLVVSIKNDNFEQIFPGMFFEGTSLSNSVKDGYCYTCVLILKITWPVA